MSTLTGTPAPNGAGTLTRSVLLIAVGLLALLVLAFSADLPSKSTGVAGATYTPTAERTYDGRGKWTGY